MSCNQQTLNTFYELRRRLALGKIRRVPPLVIGEGGGAGKDELLITSQKTRKWAHILFLIGAQTFLAALGCSQNVSLPEPPQVRAKNHVVSLSLHAVNENGRDTFAFNGASVAPVIRASPGDVLKITYVNDLPAGSLETCAVNPCMDMTNLHFHGLTVSPKALQDDVLGMLARPWPSLALHG